MAYSTISKPSLYFNTKLYTGNGGTQSITGVGFQSDWTWIKNRSSTADHQLFDAVRGAGKLLISNTTDAEYTGSNLLTAFGTDGFSLGDHAPLNGNGVSFASWNWKANGAGSANTDGSITSTVSANTTAGFSIVKWTATGSNATVGHGLGVAPSMIILKTYSTTKNWVVGHDGIGWEKNLWLNGSDAVNTGSTYWNNTAPTSSVFSVGTAGDTNDSGETIIAYCFAEKKGFSKFGSYKGNGSTNGTFVYTGFKPAFLIAKRTNAASSWGMWDSKRDPINQMNKALFPNLSNAEGTDYYVDFLSNGFKWRLSGSGENASGNTYIYWAFAEEPLVANVGASVPATAR